MGDGARRRASARLLHLARPALVDLRLGLLLRCAGPSRMPRPLRDGRPRHGAMHLGARRERRRQRRRAHPGENHRFRLLDRLVGRYPLHAGCPRAAVARRWRGLLRRRHLGGPHAPRRRTSDRELRARMDQQLGLCPRSPHPRLAGRDAVGDPQHLPDRGRRAAPTAVASGRCVARAGGGCRRGIRARHRTGRDRTPRRAAELSRLPDAGVVRTARHRRAASASRRRRRARRHRRLRRGPRRRVHRPQRHRRGDVPPSTAPCRPTRRRTRIAPAAARLRRS